MDIFWKPHSLATICTVYMFQTFDQCSSLGLVQSHDVLKHAK